MTKTIFLVLTAGSLSAAIQNVSVTEFTATQAILKYQAPDNAPCMVEVSENPNLLPLVNDVNPAKFAFASSDARPGNIQIGVERSFVIGKRAAENGLDGVRYSRALQANTEHYYRITCPGPQNVLLGSFKTDNIHFGNTFLEAQPGDSTQPGMLAQPHLGISDRTEQVIDPQTGFLMKRLTTGPDSYVDIDGYVFTVARGSGWSGLGSLFAQDNAAATIQGNNSPLFLGVKTTPGTLPYGNNFNSAAGAYSGQHVAFGYYQPHLVASVNQGGSPPANPEDAKIVACMSIDGVNCYQNAQPYEFTLGTDYADIGIGTKNSGDLLQNPGGAAPSWTEQATRQGTVACDGSTTVVYTAGYGFGQHWNPGSSINIAGVDYVINTVTDTQKMVLATPCPVNASAYWTATDFGVLIRKKTASQDSISIDYAYLNYQLNFYDNFTDGEHQLCSENTVIGPNGSPGYNCHLPGYGNQYWVDAESGEAHLYNTMGNVSGCGGENQIFDSANPDKYVCYGNGVLSSTTYYGNHAEPTGIWPHGGIRRDQGLGDCNTSGSNRPPYTNQQPCLVRAVTTPGVSIFDLVQTFASNPAYPPAYNQANFRDLVLRDIDSQGRMQFALRRTAAQTQYALAWLILFDPNATSNSEGGTITGAAGNGGCVGAGNPGCVVAAMPSWARPGCRWCVYKEGSFAYPGWIYSTVYGWQNGIGGGPYYVQGVDGSANGTLNYLGDASTFVNCPPNNRGVTGLHCSKITVGSEPFSPAHGAGETGLPGEIGNAMVGDRFSPPSNNGGFELAQNAVEQMELVQKVPGAAAGTWVYTLIRGINYQAGQTNFMVTGPNPILYTVCNSNRTPAVTASGYMWLWNFVDDPHGMNTSGDTIPPNPTDFIGHAFWSNGRWSSIEIPAYDPRCYLQQCYATRLKADTQSFVDVVKLPTPNAFISALPIWSAGSGVIDGSALQSHSTNGGSRADSNRYPYLFDGRPYRGGQASGSGGYSGDCPATLISGQLWKFTAGCMFNLELPFRKIYPTGAFSGSNPLVDVSGPTSRLGSGTDDGYKYCVAAVGGECVANSNQGDVYVNAPHVKYPFCVQMPQAANLSDEQDLCISGSPSVRDAIVQVGMNDTDLAGKTTRVLTKFTAPRRMSPFWTPYILPNGKWALFEAQYTGDTAANKVLMLGKIPPPDQDTIDRTTFVPITLRIPARAGQSAFVRFGYAENGDPASFFCTSRAESCVTVKQGDATTDPANPFFFEKTESLRYQPVSCGSGCSVTIPGIPTRALYYQVVYSDSGSNVTQSPLLVTMVP